MFWALLSAVGACANASYFIASKKFLQSLEPDTLAATAFLCTSAFLLGLSLIRGIPALGSGFFPAVAGTVFLNIIATMLTFRALKSTDISLAVPMLSFTPVFLIVTAALILHETPSLAGIFGILVLVTGSYILNTSAEHERLGDPFRAMISHPGIYSMLIVSLLYAFAVGFDKLVALNSDAVFGSGIVFLALGISFSIIALRTRKSPSKVTGNEPACDSGIDPRSPGFYRKMRDLAIPGIVLGIIITIEAIAINMAYFLQIAPYVIAIKRTSILITVLYGTLIFGEKDILRRVTGAGLMVLGVSLILIFP